MRADVDPRDAFRVYADWLQSRGDPHGQLIALACRLADAQARAPQQDEDPDQGDPPPLPEAGLLAAYHRARRALEPELLGNLVPGEEFSSHSLRYGFLDALTARVPEASVELLAKLLARPAAHLLTQMSLSDRATNCDSDLAPYLEALEACAHLRSLSIYRHRFSVPELRRLRQFSDLRELSLHACVTPVPEGETDWLGALQKLRSLGLSGRMSDAPRMMAAALAALPELPELERVELIVHGLAQVGRLEPLRGLRPLKYLGLELEAVAESELAILQDPAACAALAAHEEMSLSLDSVELSPAMYRRLASLESLRQLTLWDLEFDEDCARALEPARGLRSLDVSWIPSGDVGALLALPAFPELRSLTISNNSWMTGEALAYLERVPSLRDLDIDTCRGFDGSCIERIVACSHLHSLAIQDCPDAESGILAPLRALSERLRSLDLSWLPGFEPRDVAIIAEFPGLRTLYLCDVPVDEGTFQALASLQQLEFLYLTSCKYDDSWLAYLTSMPQLRTLTLEWAKIDRRSLHMLDEALPACDIPLGPA